MSKIVAIVVYLFAFEAILLSIFDTSIENTAILKVLTMTYFILVLLIFIIFQIIFGFFYLIVNFDAALANFQSVGQAIYLIFMMVVVGSLDTLIQLIVFPFDIINNTMGNRIEDVLREFLPDIEFSASEKVKDLWLDNYDYYIDAPYELEIVIAGGGLGKVIVSTVDKATKNERDAIETVLDAGETLIDWVKK